MDLDRFKDVNDSLGHGFGDVVLQEVARRLQRGCAATPTIARLGGDEFAVLLPIGRRGRRPRSRSPTVARGRSASRSRSMRCPVELEASIGVALSPDHGTNAAALLQRADIAMYVAKRAHTGVELFSVEHDGNSRSRLTMLGELRRAIENDELLLYYQPAARAAHRRDPLVRGAAALAAPGARGASRPASSSRSRSTPV